MEDDAVTVSRRHHTRRRSTASVVRARWALWLGVLVPLWLLGAGPALAGDKRVGFSPLPAFGSLGPDAADARARDAGRDDTRASLDDGPAADDTSRGAPLGAGLSGGRAADAEDVPFATPAPGSVPDEEEDAGEADKKAAAKKEKKIECDNDSQCPAQTICAKHACKSVQRMTSGLVYYHQPGPIGFRLVVPFYYSVWRPQKQTRVLFPLFADRKDDKEKTRNVWVFPTYQYHREPGVRSHRFWPLFFYSNYGDQGKSVGLLPLFWGSRRGDKTLAIIPPLLFFHREDRAEKRKDTVFLPLLFYLRQRPSETFSIFAGLGYYRRTEERTSGGFVPLVFHTRSAEMRRTVVLPLFYEGENKVTRDRYMTLLPLFFYRRNGDKSRVIITPLGSSHKDLETGTTTTLVAIPPTIHRDTPGYRVTVLPPISAWWRNKETGRSWGYFGPFFYTRDAEGGSEGVLPLYVHVRQNQSTTLKSDTHVLVPLLAVLHRSPTLKFGFMGPLYGWSRPPENASGGGLLPLFSFARGQKSHVAIVPPLFIYAGDREAGRHHVSIGPLFYRWRTKGADAGYDAGVFPLLFVSRHGRSSTQMLLPLFYHHREPGHERTVAGPIYYDRRCPQFCGDERAAVHAGLAPLFFYKRSPEQNYTVLFPLMWHVKTPKQTAFVLGPVFYSRKDLGPGRGEEKSGGLFPLFYTSSSKESALTIGPLFGYRRTAERRTLVIGPYVETVAAPGRPEQSVTRAFLPLFYSFCGPERRATVFFPLWLSVREKDQTVRSLAMLYWNVQRPDFRAHVLFPILWVLRGEQSQTTVLGPIFHHRDDKAGTLTAGVFPLLAFGHNKDHSYLATPLGFYDRNKVTERTRTAFLLFYGDFRKTRADYGFFPLFHHARRGTASSTWVLPFFFDSRDPAQNRALTVLGPLFFGKRDKATYGGFLPLFYGKNDGDGGYRFLFAPLMYIRHRVGPDFGNTLLTPVFGFSTTPSGARAYVGPFYGRSDAEQRTFAIFPLFYDGLNKKTMTRTSMLLPLFVRKASPESSLTMVTPIFWHYRSLSQRVTFLFPLLLDINHRYSDRITAFGPVVPLFVRSRDDINNTTTWLFPPLLTYVRKKADGMHDAVTFPIFWHFRSEKKTTTVLFPLVWYMRRPASQTTVVLPLVAYRRDEQNTKTLAILPLLTWARNYESGGRERVVFPLFWHYSYPEAKRSTTVLFPLFWRVQRPTYTATVIAPFGARWTTENGTSTLVLNTYVFRGAGDRKGAWSFHFFPLFSVGRPRPQDVEWTLLSGLVGYSRLGINRTLRLLWGIFIPLEPVGTKSAYYGASWRMQTRE